MHAEGYEQAALLHVEVPREERRVVRCRQCHRPLRDQESRALEHGPGCRVEEYAHRSWEIEQDALPGV